MGGDTAVHGWSDEDFVQAARRGIRPHTITNEQPAQATAPEYIRFGALALSQRERDLVNEAVDMVLAAERASHHSELAQVREIWTTELKAAAERILTLELESQRFLTRELVAFRAGFRSARGWSLSDDEHRVFSANHDKV